MKSTIDDLVLKVQEYRPSAVYVDGAYLLKVRGQDRGKWEQVSDTAEYGDYSRGPRIINDRTRKEMKKILGPVLMIFIVGFVISGCLDDIDEIDLGTGKPAFPPPITKTSHFFKFC